MANIAFIGLGKLGLPVATCLAQAHKVYGYDANPDRMVKSFRDDQCEEGYPSGTFQDHLLSADGLMFCSTLEGAVNFADVIFVAVQTPHDTRFDGTHRLGTERRDFSYETLERCLRQVFHALVSDRQIVVVVSTVLPGTTHRINPGIKRLVYSPQFIAMGTVMRDFMNPEFVLIGADHHDDANEVTRVYRQLLGNQNYACMSIESAELAKVTYNTAISAKLAVITQAQMVADRIPGCDIFDVSRVLKAAWRRVSSSAYLSPGGGDAGACHPRDCLALSWLAHQHQLPDLFGSLMEQRQAYAWYLALLLIEARRTSGPAGSRLPIRILGTAYKPDSKLQDGSFALLIKNLLADVGHREIEAYDEPYITDQPAVYLIGINHSRFKGMRFPEGSVVIDPYGIVDPVNQEGVHVHTVGARE